MPNNTLKEIQKGFGRKHLINSCPQGAIIAELQDHVEDIETALGITGTTSTGATNLSQAGLIAIPVSFETGEQLTHTVYFPKGATITRLRHLVTKALAGTDAGTIQAKNNAGTDMATGLITVPASSALATEHTVTPTTNNVLTAGQKAQFVVSKTTAGGKGSLFIEYTIPLS